MIKFKDLKDIKGFVEEIGLTLSEDYQVDISTDTRTLKKEQTFLALEGEKFRPLSFLNKIEKGSLVICEKNTYNNNIIKANKEFTFIKVENSIEFLQNLSSFVAHKFIKNGGNIIAINGSNGKTTTKEMLFHIMKSIEPNTLCTQKNNNNHIGVPLTLLSIRNTTKFCILELGSNHPGEIKTLCEIANPNIGLTTNIGDTHLEFFGSRKEVFSDEGYLYHSIINSSWDNSKYFQNADDEYLSTQKKISGKVVSYGKMGEDYKLNCTSSSAQVDLNGVKYVLANEYITGEHNFFNLCISTIISKELLGGEISRFCGHASSFRPTANRSQWITLDKTKIFLDAYNANPSSMRAALKGFYDEVQREGIAKDEQLFILGDMNELGENSSNFHKNIGSFIKDLGIINLVCIGRFAADVNSGFGGKAFEFQDVKEFKNGKSDTLTNYKRVFIKGSRSLQLESILDIQ